MTSTSETAFEIPIRILESQELQHTNQFQMNNDSFRLFHVIRVTASLNEFVS